MEKSSSKKVDAVEGKNLRFKLLCQDCIMMSWSSVRVIGDVLCGST